MLTDADKAILFAIEMGFPVFPWQMDIIYEVVTFKDSGTEEWGPEHGVSHPPI
jgi:hypothetical protein